VTTFAADLAAIMGDGLGRDAVYTPRGGVAVSLRVLPRGGDLAAEIGFTQGITPAAVFVTAADGLDRPRAGDELTVAGIDYVLLADARRDARGLTWVMEAQESA
jgi:hypothetical protein